MGKKPSEMTDREWRFALEQQRQVLDVLEEEEGVRKKALKDVRDELKVEKAKLGRLIRGEPEPGELDGPGLPFEGPDNQSLAAGEKPDGKRKRGRGPRAMEDDGEPKS